MAIIGAGISGLLACKYAVAAGFRPTVFEAQSKIGGLWNHTLESTRLQTPKQVFEFSDFPWPSSVKEDFPLDTQLLDYLQSYAENFGLLPYIKFNSQVIGIDYEGESDLEMQSSELWAGTGKAFGSKGKWKIEVQVQHDEHSSIQEYTAEFVILCIGRFSGLPSIPEFPQDHGPEVFYGKMLHSMDFSAMDNAEAVELIKGKKVAIVGAQKSALDVAALCANVNGSDNPCTIIVRTPHWMLPSYYVWGVPLALLYLSRFSELLIHKPGEGLLFGALASLLSPLRWGIAKFCESYLRWKLPLKKYDMMPPHSFLQDVSACTIVVLQDNFYSKVEEGCIRFKRSKSIGFCKEGLTLGGEGATQTVKADIVILATGYKGDEKLRNIFTSPTFQKCITGSSNSAIPLYRQMIHPRIPQLAAIGYSESLNNLYTTEMRCRWLVHFLDETIQLPSIKEMEKDVLMWENYMKSYAGNYYRRSCVGALHICYNDQLLKDIGCNPKRKKGFIAELFQPYGPADYLELTSNS